jgi:hypothetical protein
VRLPFAIPRRRSLAAGGAVLVALAAGIFVVSPWAERRIASRIVREAAARGLLATVERVDVGLLPPLAITGLRVEKPGSWSLTAPSVRVTLRVWGRGIAGRTRIALGPIAVSAPSGLSLDAAPSRWKVEGTAEGGFAAELEDPDEEEAAKFITSADSLLSANSNESLVRVEFSKNRLAIVTSLNDGTFFIGRLITSLKLSAVENISSISSLVIFFIPKRCLVESNFLWFCS